MLRLMRDTKSLIFSFQIDLNRTVGKNRGGRVPIYFALFCVGVVRLLSRMTPQNCLLENSTKKMIQYFGIGILPVLVLVAGKMPTRNFGIFFDFASL
jgi:hypothetical protein